MTLNEPTYRFLQQLADYSHTLSGLDHVWNIFGERQVIWHGFFLTFHTTLNAYFPCQSHNAEK